MKALIYTGPEKSSTRTPQIQFPNQKKRLFEWIVICGSDMHAFLGHDERRPAPLILGHEAAGVVVQGPMRVSDL